MQQNNQLQNHRSIPFLNYLLVLFLLPVLYACTSPAPDLQEGTISIIPNPVVLTSGEGHFWLDANTSISVENEQQAAIARQFFGTFEAVSGWQPTINQANEGAIKFRQVDNHPSEGYHLTVTEQEITIEASSLAGFFYALQSFRQLLPDSFFSNQLQEQVVWGIPVVNIQDQPRFEWRGFMLDVSRHFFEVEEVKKVLDYMASLKMNRFHWHLTDDQGWRIEIKKYPALTEVGAWRMDYKNTDETISDWWGRPVQQPGEKPTYGGFYTQDQIKDIIAYAKDRFIEVVPELDMPGHAQAMVAAIPEIGCVDALPYVATGGVFKNNTLNPGKAKTYEVVKDILEEVADLFPYNYIHIGGDECNKSQWKVDPDAQSKMKEEGLASEEALQSYFIKQVEKMINGHGKTMIGWDEILEGGLAPNATVMSWRGEEGGITAAKAGHEVIMTPNKYTYIDLKQGHDDLEPNLGYSRLLLSTCYNYEVLPAELSPEEQKLIKGIQANLWTESISDWGKLNYMTFPRVFAVAENAWTPSDRKDWKHFTDRLETQFQRLDQQKIRYAVSAFTPWIDHEGRPEGIAIALKTEANGLNIHYTLDGSDPTLESNAYVDTFMLDQGALLSARAFKDGIAVGKVAQLSFPIHKAAHAKCYQLISGTKEPLPKLTDLNYGRLSVADDRFQKLSNKATIAIQFDAPTSVKSVQFKALRFTISGYYSPESAVILGSVDGNTFTELGRLDQIDISHTQGRNKVHHAIEFEEKELMALQLKLQSPSILSQGHHRAGESSKMKIDEIVVE